MGQWPLLCDVLVCPLLLLLGDPSAATAARSRRYKHGWFMLVSEVLHRDVCSGLIGAKASMGAGWVLDVRCIHTGPSKYVGGWTPGSSVLRFTVLFSLATAQPWVFFAHVHRLPLLSYCSPIAIISQLHCICIAIAVLFWAIPILLLSTLLYPLLLGALQSVLLWAQLLLPKKILRLSPLHL